MTVVQPVGFYVVLFFIGVFHVCCVCVCVTTVCGLTGAFVLTVGSFCVVRACGMSLPFGTMSVYSCDC